MEEKTNTPSKGCFITPRRTCSSKYRVTSPSPSVEDIFSSSPLKSFFESPIFKKEDIKLKEKEIVKTTGKLHEVEIKCDELHFELKEAKKQLREKDKEIKKLKAIQTRQGLDKKKYEEDIEDENHRLKNEIEQMQKEHEREMSVLTIEHSYLKFCESEYNKMKSYSKAKDLETLLNKKDTMLEKQKAKIEFYKFENENFLKENEELHQKLAESRKEIDEVRDDKLKEQSLYRKKLSEMKKKKGNKDPELPATGENLGRIIEEENRVLLEENRVLLEENRVLHCRIKEIEKQLKKYEMAQPEEIPVPDTGNVFHNSMPVLLSETETPEAQKLNCSKKDEVFSGLPDECDFSSNSEVASKHSATSSHSEGKCLYDSQGNLLNKSCRHCNKIHVENESIKMTQEHSIQLVKQEEEIHKLKACLETMQKDLVEKRHKIEHLENQMQKNKITLDKKKAKCKEYEQRILSLEKSLQSEINKNADYEQMVEKVKLIDYEKARWQKMHKDEVQQLNIAIDKMEKEKYKYEVQYINITKLNRNLKVFICKLESQKQDLHQQLKTAQEDSLKKTKELKYLNEYLEKKQEAAKLDSVFSEMNASTSRDICNESMLSGALCRKNGFQFISHDEADFLNQSSLEDIKKDYKEEDRMKELLRRNSFVPPHLKSSYPLEMNLSLSTDKFYVTQRLDSPISENPGETEQHNTPVNKKRKQELDSEYYKNLLYKSPLRHVRRFQAPPRSLNKLLKGHVKAKPSSVS